MVHHVNKETADADVSNLSRLQQALAEIIPGAQLERVDLPGTPIQLMLMNRDYPQHSLSPDAVQRVMNNPLYWVFCWASGQVLAQLLLEEPQRVRGKRVLDFGCGSGVVAIAAKLAGAREVIACDIDPDALAATQINADLNGVALTLCADYFEVEGLVDLIVVADVLYDRENLGWLDRYVQRAPHTLIADSRVKNFDHAPYRMIGRRESCTIPDLDESAEFRDVRIYEAAAQQCEPI